MIKKHCDVPGCGRPIESNEISKQGVTVRIPGIGQMSAYFTFNTTRPDICNHCVLTTLASLIPADQENAA